MSIICNIFIYGQLISGSKFSHADQEALRRCFIEIIKGLVFTASDTFLAHPEEGYQAEAERDQVEVFNLLNGRVCAMGNTSGSLLPHSTNNECNLSWLINESNEKYNAWRDLHVGRSVMLQTQ